jgi:hypothetical protein
MALELVKWTEKKQYPYSEDEDLRHAETIAYQQLKSKSVFPNGFAHETWVEIKTELKFPFSGLIVDDLEMPTFFIPAFARPIQNLDLNVWILPNLVFPFLEPISTELQAELQRLLLNYDPNYANSIKPATCLLPVTIPVSVFCTTNRFGDKIPQAVKEFIMMRPSLPALDDKARKQKLIV